MTHPLRCLECDGLEALCETCGGSGKMAVELWVAKGADGQTCLFDSEPSTSNIYDACDYFDRPIHVFRCVAAVETAEVVQTIDEEAD